MLKSMTGYGKAIYEENNKKILIEIKTLNSKQLDINARIPGLYKEKEIEIRNLISQKLERGKVDLSIFVELSGNSQSSVLNTEVLKNYYLQIKDLQTNLNLKDTDYLQLLLKLPDAIKSEYKELEEDEYDKLRSYIISALNDVESYRCNEGKVLENDIKKHIAIIQKLLSDIEIPEKSRMEKIKSRLKNNLKEFFENEQIDHNRFEQEILYYLEKLDITEEKVRLKNHCNYFIETIKNESSAGKKLGFIAQEIGREINTIGSKANDSNIQNIVIQMKDELEKIKEQTLNIL